ncbi:hypothetical protein RHGRI_024603 [Rhododendron griersonianum]|uniref:Uncharacterized protein n=1 Tax=Rhododendron griersonianum TaxID=479676 RepID=A0AAV6JCZ1_9ERIC|nr:hypothetical protein RHGRI_024603 [Rhododendron griersonianum]
MPQRTCWREPSSSPPPAAAAGTIEIRSTHTRYRGRSRGGSSPPPSALGSCRPRRHRPPIRHLKLLRRQSQGGNVEGHYKDMHAITEVGDESERASSYAAVPFVSQIMTIPLKIFLCVFVWELLITTIASSLFELVLELERSSY